MTVNFSDYNNIKSVQKNLINNSIFNKNFLLNFCGLKTLDMDTVELSAKKIENDDKISEKPQYPLKVKIKDTEGNYADAVINDVTPKSNIKNSTGILALTVEDTQIAGINFYPKDNHIYIDYLYNNKPGLGYKGAGTELLKCAVRESKAYGFGGAAELHAQQNGTNTPIPFYYKNNFRFKNNNVLKEALTLYTIQNKIPSNQVFGLSDGSADMILDREGANALLEGNRLYKDRKLVKIDEKIIKDNHDNIYSCTSYLFDPKIGNKKCIVVFGEDEFGCIHYLPVILETANNNEKKHFVITDIPYNNFGSRDMKKNGLCAAMAAIEKLEEKYNYDKTTVKKNIFKNK